MLDRLFGSKSIETILFFLLINGRSYAGKLARHFNSPLTPIQQGLQKLEVLGIAESYWEGKVRYYQLNVECPIMAELEALLRKAYTRLPTSEKKEYYDPEFKQRQFNSSSKKEREFKSTFTCGRRVGHKGMGKVIHDK